MTPILAYWNVRGLAQPIRFLLHYCGEKYEEKLYSVGPGPEFCKKGWFSVKYKLGLPFPNLPYYIDDDVKLSESKAIMRYIARKHNLLGQTDIENANVDMLLDVCAEVDYKASMVYMSPDLDKIKDEFIKTSDEIFQNLENYGQGNTWFTGDKITVADFFLYEYFKRVVVFHEPLLENHQWIKEFVARFEALPAIKKYMESEEFIDTPYNNPYYSWTGK